MKRYQLIAIDVDGTLITDDHRITDRTKASIRAVHEQGSRIVLCTGRGPGSTLPLLRELGLTGIAVTHNGGATVQSENEQVLHQFAYEMNALAKLVAYCRERGIHFDANTAFDLYVEQLSDDSREMYGKYLAEPIEIADVMELTVPIVKFCIFAEGAVLDQLTADWHEIGNPELRIIRSGDYFIDVMHHKANKGNALRSLAEREGVTPDQILAIGNYFNDLEMIEYAGLGIAMGNSPEGVKQKADAVTSTNNEEGVSEALEKYCL